MTNFASLGNIKSLPSGIMLEILSRVPLESVSDCKLVCKKWNTLIRCSGSHFTKMHFSRQLQRLHDKDGTNDNIFAEEEVGLLFAQTGSNRDTSLFYGGNFAEGIHEKFSIKEKFIKVSQPPLHNNFPFPHLVGSCNGLVCLFIRHDKVSDPIYIFNPITKEEVYLPELVVTERMCKATSSGFGYISSTNQYKIVRIIYPSHPHKGQIQVYTLGSGCGWRDKGTTSKNMETAGIHVNGIIYWLGVDSIGSFDLADEEFRFVSVPPLMVELMFTSKEHYGLTSFGGHLCFYAHSQHMEIWSYKKKSWCFEFDIQYEDVLGSEVIELMPLLLTKNNEIIFLFDFSTLYCYDPRTAALGILFENDSSTDFVAMKGIPYVKTFASLRAIGEISGPE